MISAYINIPTLSWRPPVDTAVDLPSIANQVGDAIVTQDTQKIYIWSGSAWVLTGGPGGTVTSVGLALPSSVFTVTGSPVTTAGTLTGSFNSQSANQVLASPNGSSGVPTFRSLVAADIPALAYVTSVALSMPAEFSVAGSPITSSGTFTVTKSTETANTVWAGPTSGGAAQPTFRALVTADLPAGTGTVTSVALSDGSTTPIFNITGSPVTTSGTLTETLKTQSANTVFAGPTSGGAVQPTFRSLVSADIPALAYVTSVALALPASVFSVTGSPVTSSGTLTGSFISQSANTFFAAPNGSSGTPTFRTIVTADLPNLFTVATKSANFTAASGFIYLVQTSGGAISVQLPAPSSGLLFTVKDSQGTANTNAITLVRNGAEQIEGLAASKVLQSNWGSWDVVSDGTNWFLV